MKQNVVFIGGRESGKTSLIRLMWADEAQSFEEKQGVGTYGIKELIPGREIVEYNVFELPKVRYTNDNPTVPSVVYNQYLQSADVIVIAIEVNDLSVNERFSFYNKLFSTVQLKKDVIITIALVKSDIFLTPKAANNNIIDRTEQITLSAVSNLIKTVTATSSAFNGMSSFDKTFSPESVVACSFALDWNINKLKYLIWNGIVVGKNNDVFDSNIPTVVIAGKTGCGKTSTINKLWGLNLAVDKAVSCTKFPAVMHIEDIYRGEKIVFNLVDLPGIAESVEANSLYHEFYYNYIKKSDVLICLTQADRRAYKQDELFYKELIKAKVLTIDKQIVLGINQADLLFKTQESPNGINLKTINKENPIIVEKTRDLYDGIFKDVFKTFNNVTMESVIIYSVLQDWNMNSMKSKIYSLIKKNKYGNF